MTGLVGVFALRPVFVASAWEAKAPTSPLRTLARSRWPDDWSGLLVQTWVPLNADAATLRAALHGLVDVCEALERVVAKLESP